MFKSTLFIKYSSPPKKNLIQNNNIFKSWYIYMYIQIIINFNLHFKSIAKCNFIFVQHTIRLNNNIIYKSCLTIIL